MSTFFPNIKLHKRNRCLLPFPEARAEADFRSGAARSVLSSSSWDEIRHPASPDTLPGPGRRTGPGSVPWHRQSGQRRPRPCAGWDSALGNALRGRAGLALMGVPLCSSSFVGGKGAALKRMQCHLFLPTTSQTSA